MPSVLLSHCAADGKNGAQNAQTLRRLLIPSSCPTNYALHAIPLAQRDFLISKALNTHVSAAWARAMCSKQDAFVSTRSCVLKLTVHQSSLAGCLPTVMSFAYAHGLRPTVWTSCDEWSKLAFDYAWLIFRAHEEAVATLSLSDPHFSLAPALESDLEPIQKLQKYPWCEMDSRTASSMTSHQEPSFTTFSPISPTSAAALPRHVLGAPGPSGHDFRNHQGEVVARPPPGTYTISSNPPNPKMSFRAGDWVCTVPSCAAHNFGRNVVCIGCGGPRSLNRAPQSLLNGPLAPSPAHPISPRFMTSPTHPLDAALAQTLYVSPQVSSLPPYADPQRPVISSAPQSPSGLKAPLPSYPLLTPSGHALSAGGRVRNISSDPLCPCIMYWPDNEPLPERSQIRPLGSAVIQYPPIINTGNKGAAEKQPGDWVCGKCNYLNWRRRKVCQTCYPYAEGNGDSISAAVQAERIALLTDVLNKVDPTSQPQSKLSPATSLNRPTVHDNLALRSAPDGAPFRRGVSRSLSEIDLGAQYKASSPIYQTSGHPVEHTFIAPAPRHVNADASDVSRTLLPSFLQDIVHSPSLSPATSSSSVDICFEYDPSEGARRMRQGRSNSTRSSSCDITNNIWKLDGEESKNFNITTAAHHDCVVDLAGRMAKGLSGLGSM